MGDIALVYMVAGLSSRFGGKIKQFAEVGLQGETLIEVSLSQALPAGFTKIIFIVGEKTEIPFKEKFGDRYNGIPVYYAVQNYDSKIRKKPWGTNDSLCSAKGLIDCPFVVCNGDDLYGKEPFKILVQHLKRKLTDATIGYKLGEVLPEEGEVNRGIFKIKQKTNIIECLKEEFKISKANLVLRNLSRDDLCSMNIFALYPKTLELLNKILIEFKEKHKNNPEIECLLPEEINRLITAGKITMEIYPTNEKWMGITNPGDEIMVKESLKNKN
ncbi:MAG: sugar phosphate nucleotidyltransferase [Nanoarchaeota archaeon]|nr:sugar phosphate nucleotidyltransferase [Nanoarchaeota archaeon]